MRVAWFVPATASVLDDTAPLLDELAATHEIARYDEQRAHQFVWHHARRPFDLCVHELTDSGGAAFIWPYLLHYPGILRLRSGSLHSSRARTLQHERRAEDYAREVAFGGALRIPLLASRLVVVGDAYLAATLQDAHPEPRVRVAPLGVRAISHAPPPDGATPVFAVLHTTRVDAVQRAAARARDAGSRFHLAIEPDADQAVRAGDAIVVMPWPPTAEPPVPALLAMAAARPAVVYETSATAGWPALDPQTWQPRGGLCHAPPIAVSIDPRDEEHSLMLAFKRLADDAALRRRLGTAAHAWWSTHATPAAAAAAWRPLLDEAAALQPPDRPAGWPPHLSADGSERTRRMLAELDVTVDFLT